MNFSSPLVWVFLVVGLAVGYAIRNQLGSKKANSAEQKIKEQLDEARKRADALLSDAQKKALSVVEDGQKIERDRKEKLDKIEERLLKREETMEGQLVNLSAREGKLSEELRKTETLKTEATTAQKKAVEQLEKIAGLKTEEARDKIIKETQVKYQGDLVSTIQKMEKERRDEVEKKAQKLLPQP